MLPEGPLSQGAQESITFEASVGLNDELPGFLAEQHRVPEGEEALGGRIGDCRIPLIQGPASGHIPRGLQHLWEGRSQCLWMDALHEFTGLCQEPWPAAPCPGPRLLSRGHADHVLALSRVHIKVKLMVAFDCLT